MMHDDGQPTLKMTSGSIDEQEDAETQALCELALELAMQLAAHPEGRPLPEALRQKQSGFQKLIKKCILQKNDEVLYDALERARFTDLRAYRYLKPAMEEASETVFIRRDEKTTWEINAFVIPLLLRSTGGLQQQQDFQDQEAFEMLTASLQEAGLESREARVVLINHAYHMDEIDGITYSHVNEMIRDAAASLNDKRGAAITAIERSLTGWPEQHFAADDLAVELRFLLGFSMKKTDDPFYRMPDEEAAADAWFDARAQRFQAWSEQVKPLVARCMVNDGRALEINFLYQDLFHGGKAAGMAEYFLLQMMAELTLALEDKKHAPADVRALVAPLDLDGELVLQVQLHAKSNATLVASARKPLDPASDVQFDIDDVHDGLASMGITEVSVAQRFDAAGLPVKARPYS